MRWLARQLGLVAATAVALTLAASASMAGSLDPTAPSQVVQIRTFGTACSGSGGQVLDLRTNKDGSATLNYVLPPKHVLVARQVRFDAFPGAGQGVIVELTLGGNLIAYSVGTGDSTPGLANGHYQGTFEFDPGLVVSDISKLCITTQNGASPFATAVGFLAKDK